MDTAISNRLSTEDYRALGEGPPHYQLIEGKLFMSPSPNRYHQVICRNLLLLLGGYLEANPVGDIYQPPSDVYLTDFNVFQPDLFFIAAANASILTEQGVAGAPDLVVEVISPGSAHLDREIKRKVYAQCGVKELWLVDPESKQIQVYDYDPGSEERAHTHDLDSTFTSPLFPGLTISGAAVFKPSRLG